MKCENEKFTLILILIQFFEMHGAGSVNLQGQWETFGVIGLEYKQSNNFTVHGHE